MAVSLGRRGRLGHLEMAERVVRAAAITLQAVAAAMRTDVLARVAAVATMAAVAEAVAQAHSEAFMAVPAAVAAADHPGPKAAR
jgi:hypothetical protein